MEDYLMNRRMKTATAVILLSLLAGTSGAAQQRGGGWGSGSSYDRQYNPESVETIAGEVLSIERITPMNGMSYGIHAIVRTEKESISVHLGPGWYIDNLDTDIVPGDNIRVKGSRIVLDGKPVIIAAEVIKGEDVLRLRDADGVPVWSGWRRR
jgi:hypothetical protein